MKLFLSMVLLIGLLGCSRNSRLEQAVEDYITVCGVMGSEDARRIANSTIELYSLHSSPKETNDPAANRYQRARADQNGQVQAESSCSEPSILASDCTEDRMRLHDRTGSSADSSNRSTSL